MKLRLFILIFNSSVLFSQILPYHHYNQKNGLPSSNVMDMIQDRQGYLWFATADGVCRFDGYSFVNYGVNEGLNSTMITSLAEGKDGEIYVGNHEKGINIIKNGKISNLMLNLKKPMYINHLLISDNKLYAYNEEEKYEFNEDVNEFVLDTNHSFLDGEIYSNLNKLKILSNNNIIALTNKGLYRFTDDKFLKIQMKGFNNEVVYCLTEDKKNKILYAGGKGRIYVIKDFKIVDEINVNFHFDDDIFRILIDNNGNLWFSIISHGFYFIPSATKKTFDFGKRLGLKNTQINKIFEDNEGNIWVCTFDRGIYCFNNLYITNYSEDDGLSNNNIQTINMDENGKIYTGTFNGMNILDKQNFTVVNSGFKNNFTDFINNIFIKNNTVYISGSFGNNNLYKSRLVDNINYVFITSTTFCQTRDNTFLIGNWGNGIFKSRNINGQLFIDSNYMSIFGDHGMNNRINNVLEDSKGRLWIGTALGLCRMDRNNKKIYAMDDVLNGRIVSIIEDKKGKIWFAGDKGIAVYDPESDSMTNFKIINGYDVSSSTALATDYKNRLWFGNKKGIYIYNYISLDHLDMSDGLPSNEIQAIYYDNLRNNMWIGTSSGLCRLDVTSFDDHTHLPLNIKLNKITVNDSLYSIDDVEELNYNQNNVKIDFTAINYSSPESVIYSYKINENKWQEIKSNSLQFSELEPKKYDILLRAKRLNDGWSEPYEIIFEINPPIYKNKLAVSSGALIFTFFIIMVAKIKIRNNRRRYIEKLELTDRMNELKHQSVAAMMNPHFIFNSLSSVQYLVNLNKQQEANDYISLMARLVRLNLDTSIKSFITIEEELKRLNLYLTIEKLRLEDKFNYSLIISNDIVPANVSIPNMIIQPFVENSIWHGIAHINNTGSVIVDISFEDVRLDNYHSKYLIIRITDNGVGISNINYHNKNNGHTSRAINIIKDRLTILSKKLDLPAPIDINDLGKRDNDSTGTEVIISLPPDLYKVNDPV